MIIKNNLKDIAKAVSFFLLRELKRKNYIKNLNEKGSYKNI